MVALMGNRLQAHNSPETKVALKERIDKLYEQYLNALDQHQEARKQLARQLSSGFISLAQANFSPQARIRYGQDYYDQRMQALRRVSIDATKDGPSVLVASTAVCSGDNIESSEGEQADEKDKKDLPKVPVDPIRWFGVLVPPALKAAQSSFTEAVETQVPTLVNLDQTLKRLEIEIRRVRKQLGRAE